MKKIYILEDDEDISNLLTQVLGKEGFNTSVFASINSLIQYMEIEQPDLIISDVHLTEETILEFLKIRKLDKELLKVPVIMLSSENQKDRITEILTYKIQDYILKTINIKLLLNSINKVLFGKVASEHLFLDSVNTKAECKIEFSEISETELSAILPIKLEYFSDF